MLFSFFFPPTPFFFPFFIFSFFLFTIVNCNHVPLLLFLVLARVSARSRTWPAWISYKRIQPRMSVCLVCATDVSAAIIMTLKFEFNFILLLWHRCWHVFLSRTAISKKIGWCVRIKVRVPCCSEGIERKKALAVVQKEEERRGTKNPWKPLGCSWGTAVQGRKPEVPRANDE